MVWHQVKGNWKQLSGEVKRQWGKLNDDHLTEINGNIEKLEGKIQEAYGVTKDEAKKQIEAWQQTPTYRDLYDRLHEQGDYAKDDSKNASAENSDTSKA